MRNKTHARIVEPQGIGIGYQKRWGKTIGGEQWEKAAVFRNDPTLTIENLERVTRTVTVIPSLL